MSIGRVSLRRAQIDQHAAADGIAARSGLTSDQGALDRWRKVHRQFGDAAEFDDPVGGIFLWVTLPESVDTSRLAQAALQAGVAINPGAEWMTDAVPGRRRLRLCFAHPSPEVIGEGVARLAEVCHREFGVPVREANPHR